MLLPNKDYQGLYPIVKKRVADKRFIESKVYQFFRFPNENINLHIERFLDLPFNICTKHIQIRVET